MIFIFKKAGRAAKPINVILKLTYMVKYVQMIIQGNDFLTAIKTYYKELSSTSTRANIFLSYIDFPTVKSRIFYELIDKDMIKLMFAAADLQNYQLVDYYDSLINNE